MKNINGDYMRRITKLLAAILLLCFCLSGCSNVSDEVNKNDVNNNIDIKKEVAEPLIIELNKDIEPLEGVITITGAGVEPVSYEGLLLIRHREDGKIEVIATDAIRDYFYNKEISNE
jgi:hypothetical protein